MSALAFALLALAAPAARAEVQFDEALRQILVRSTSIGTQRNNLEATRARNLPIKLEFTPSVSLDASRTATKSQGQDETTGSAASATARLNLFRFGADYENLRAAGYDESSQERQLDATVLRTEDLGVQALVAEISQQLQIQVLDRILKAEDLLARIAGERYRRGLLPLQESQKVEVDRANAQARLRDAQIVEAQTRATLENAWGRSDVLVGWPWRDRLARPAAQKLEREELKLESIPAWHAASEQLHAEEARESRNFRAILPSIDSSFSYGYGNGYTNLFGTNLWGWTGTISATFPLYDHLANYSAYRTQVYTRQSAELALEQAARDARAQLNEARGAFALALATATERERVVDLSRRLYLDGQRRFQAGRENANDLDIDQRRLNDSELLAIQGWTAAHLAFTRLCHALGHSVFECAAPL